MKFLKSVFFMFLILGSLKNHCINIRQVFENFNMKNVITFLNQGNDVNEIYYHVVSLLTRAIIDNNCEIAEMLIMRGAKIHKSHISFAEKNKEIVRLLTGHKYPQHF